MILNELLYFLFLLYVFEELLIWKYNRLESLNIDLLYKGKASLKNYCKSPSYKRGKHAFYWIF